MTTLVAGVALIATLAAFAQALSGFGFALVAVPLVTLLTGPQTAVTVVTALGCVLALAMGVQERRHVAGRTVVLV
ncbi:sulfite exporter TauE/SafE family protein, partial [Nonomuraea sp. K271]|nr:sulfite exporter TauE/SafE family protein [Nonomuraea sp. K271]